MPDGPRCKKCKSEIDRNASRCPSCGFDPIDFLPLSVFVSGLLTTLTVIGAIVGIPAMIAGVVLWLKRESATPAGDSIWYRELGEFR